MSRSQRNWIFVRITMSSYLVSCLRDHASLFWKCLDRVSGSKPRCFDLMFLEKAKQTRNSYLTSEQTTLDIIRRIFTTVRTKPSCHRVDVNPISYKNFFLHHPKTIIGALRVLCIYEFRRTLSWAPVRWSRSTGHYDTLRYERRVQGILRLEKLIQYMMEHPGARFRTLSEMATDFLKKHRKMWQLPSESPISKHVGRR